MKQPKDFSLEELNDAIEEYMEKHKDKVPYSKKVGGMWEVSTGTHKVWMNDHAYNEMNKQMLEIAKKDMQ